MDILLTEVGELVYVEPQSAAGMLWLQCHFTNDEWDHLSDSFKLSRDHATFMAIDAEDAGLTLKY